MNVWLATDKDGEIMIYDAVPCREQKLGFWEGKENCVGNCVQVSYDKTMEVLGFVPTWEDEPIQTSIDFFKPKSNL